MRGKSTVKDDFNEKLLKLTIPMALQSLMLAAVAAADAFMLGLVEQNSMAAVSLASQIQFVQNLFLTTVTSTLIVLGAQYWGKKDILAVKDLFHFSLKLNMLISLLFFSGCAFFPKILMRIFTNEPALISIGSEYLKIASWSYLLTGISQCYLSVMKLSEHMVQAARISISAVLVNILLNYIFIFGIGPIPAAGAKGAAAATLAARIIELFLCLLFSYQKSYIAPDRKHFFKTSRLLCRDFTKCGLPILGASLFWGVGFTSYSAFMGHLGTDVTAANSVASVVRDLVCCLCEGISRGGGIMVGNELGASHLEQGKLYGIRIMKLAFICGLISMTLMLAVTPLLLNSVMLSEEAMQTLKGMMLIMSFYMIGRAVNTILINGIFASGGDTMFDLYSLAVCMWGIAIPLATLGTFVFHWPPLLIYGCTCLDEVGKIPWVMHHFRKYKWVRDLTRESAIQA